MDGYAGPSSRLTETSQRPALPSLGTLKAADRDVHRWRTGLLADVIRIVVEAALEAELVVHLGYRRGGAGVDGRGNARNGYRAKIVRTAFGRISIDAPRDRWGTFEPLTVGKWQRSVSGIDQLAVPLAALGANRPHSVALLARLYGPSADPKLPELIAAELARRMQPWHERGLDPEYRALLLDRVVVRCRDGRAVAAPVQTVVGLMGDGGCELLALRASEEPAPAGSWYPVLADLYARGLRDVGAVRCDPGSDVAETCGDVWPDALVYLREDVQQADCA